MSAHQCGSGALLSESWSVDITEWNSDHAYPDGLYLGIRYRSDAGEWNVDIWCVSELQRQPDLPHLESFLPRFDERTRLIILRAKARVPNAESAPSIATCRSEFLLADPT